ncbi:manganese-dependent inorganic pyrophosphatase [Psychromonas ossibalaenae]|uniref:manganese-dependent inorganic pyrophosphatase n=1 Tax=Psychromonas ossibalaenae TaxID=444922 RepID=UPI000362F11A|nr:manganese-dependent inorganic pyrophosphatase [Psychromonas ossibalaenae]
MKFSSVFLSLAVISTAGSAFELNDPKKNDTHNLVWTGHLSPDTDSMTAAIAAAYIYGGTAVMPQETNPESRFVLEYCQAEAPRQLDDFTDKQVGLVDFNQKTQLHKTIDPGSITAIIDHHAIGGSPVNLAQVAAIDIRPWGSAATIAADHAASLNIILPKQVACTTLAGILSDTVVLQSATTTQYDRDYAVKLAEQAGISDFHSFGEQMLIAKSDLSKTDAATILTMDYKTFEYAGKKVGIGVAETLTAQQLTDRKDEFITAMQVYKKENNLDHLFFSVTDTKNKQANLLWIDEADAAVAQAAFQGQNADGWLQLKNVTSRKRQIGPAIQRAVEAGN